MVFYFFMGIPVFVLFNGLVSDSICSKTMITIKVTAKVIILIIEVSC